RGRRNPGMGRSPRRRPPLNCAKSGPETALLRLDGGRLSTSCIVRGRRPDDAYRDPMIGRSDKIWFRRGGLFAKYVVSLVGLVVFVLAVNGAFEIWFSYRETRATLTNAMSEKAEAAARRIEQSMSELERQI